jgi:hypothetical protein
MIMVVDEIERMAPKNKLSIKVHPKIFPIKNPKPFINVMPTIAVMKATPPTFTSFLKLNSRPSENKRKMTPISDHIFIPSSSTTVGIKETCGPTKIPAIT